MMFRVDLHGTVDLIHIGKVLLVSKCGNESMFVYTWIEPMVVINSQPWGIGHWFVFKRVCVHRICMKNTYFSDSF